MMSHIQEGQKPMNVLESSFADKDMGSWWTSQTTVSSVPLMEKQPAKQG